MTAGALAPVQQFILAEWQQRRAAPQAIAAAQAILARYGSAAQAALFYGSCLRTGQVDDRILDFYILVNSYRQAYGQTLTGRLLAAGNALVPPNVFYHENQVGGETVRSKYAVLSLDAFDQRVSRGCLSVSVWARFSQPALCLAAASPAVEQRLAAATAQAVCTMLANTPPANGDTVDSAAWWTAAFENTYSAELRAEKPGKGAEIYALDRARYDRLTPLAVDALAQSAPSGSQAGWWRRRLIGKIESLARLIKAAATFSGGIDYLAWKISRHSGVPVEIRPWMRRVPVLAGLWLFLSLRLRGAFR